MKLTGARILWECLVREGVTDVFGYPGGAILPAYDAMLDYPIRHVLVRHEQGAGHAAQGYAAATGRVGVCMATSGPGATNLVTPIADAHMDSVPMVAVTGQVRIAIKGGKTLTGTVRNGKVVVRLPKARKKMRLTVTYTGSDLAEPASERLRIKVRRR